MNHEDASNIADAPGLTEAERTALAEDDSPAPMAAQEAEAETVEFRDDPAPILTASMPNNAASVLNRVDQFEEQVEQQFRDGAITSREYRNGLRQAADAREEIQWRQRKADLASEMNEQAKESAWFREVDRFMSTTGAGIAKSEAAKIAFDEHVKAVTADPANQHLSDRAQLEKAHKLFMADMGSAFGASAARQPASHAQPDMGGGDFAALDRLADSDPEAYEAALARMSPAELERYGR